MIIIFTNIGHDPSACQYAKRMILILIDSVSPIF